MPDNTNQNNPYAAYSDPRLYMDALGKGAMIAQPIAQPDPANSAIGRHDNESVGAGEGVLKDDYLSSLFSGEELSEEFKLKATTIFEAAINEKVSLIEAEILKAAQEIIAEQVSVQEEKLVEHVDGYLNYVITEWMSENQVAIEQGLRTEIAENFIHGLKDLFENSFIDVPDEKYNILDDLYDANAELQENVNHLIKENLSLKNEITARLCAEAFIEESQDLADTQVEKLAKLAEGIEFNDVDQYRQKVSLLKESYFGGNGNSVESTPSSNNVPTNYLAESGSFVADSGTENPVMENVVNAISMINKNKPKPAFNSNPENPIATRIQNIMSIPTTIPQDRLF